MACMHINKGHIHACGCMLAKCRRKRSQALMHTHIYTDTHAFCHVLAPVRIHTRTCLKNARVHT